MEIDSDEDWTQVAFPDVFAQEEVRRLAACENDALSIEHESSLIREQEFADEMHATDGNEVSGLQTVTLSIFLLVLIRMELLCLIGPLQTMHVMSNNYMNLPNLLRLQQGTFLLLALRATLQTILLAWHVVVCNMQVFSSFGKRVFGITFSIQTKTSFAALNRLSNDLLIQCMINLKWTVQSLWNVSRSQ